MIIIIAAVVIYFLVTKDDDSSTEPSPSPTLSMQQVEWPTSLFG